jgi:D-alanine-D-alanine ligase
MPYSQECSEALIEEYIDGREFTVLIAANADGKTATAFRSVEFTFPEGNTFEAYACKNF